MPEMRVPATLLNQNGVKIYLFGLPSDTLRRICYVLPRSKDNPREIQRVLSKSRLDSIGEYLRNATALLPNNLVLNLHPDVVFVAGALPNQGVLVFPSDGSDSPSAITSDSGKHAYILDGQHRLAGFEHAGNVVFDLPVSAFADLNKERAAKVFADINSNQVKVSPLLLQEILHEIGSLKAEKSVAVQVVEKLNEHSDSPWRGKIKTATQKGVVSAVTMAQYLVPILSNDGPLAEKSVNEQAAILKNYFAAWKALFPLAWGDNKFVLTKGIGLYLMAGLFRKVYNRCEKFEGGDMSADSFALQMAPLKPIAWDSGTYGKFSNAKGMNALWKAALLSLPLDSSQAPSYKGFEDLGINI